MTLLLLASFNLNFANLQCFQKFTRRWRGLPHSPSTVGAWSECQGALRVLLTFCKMPRWVFNSCSFWRYCNLGLQEEVSVGRNRKSNAKVCDGPNVSRNHLKLIRLVILSFLGVYVQGAFFNCSHPKISKCQPVSKLRPKKLEYQNCSHPKKNKERKKLKYPNCSHPKKTKREKS